MDKYLQNRINYLDSIKNSKKLLEDSFHFLKIKSINKFKNCVKEEEVIRKVVDNGFLEFSEIDYIQMDSNF